MKSSLIAVAVLLLLIVLIFTNSVYIDKKIDEICTGLEALDIGDSECEASFSQLRAEFDGARKIITLSVSHDDISSIEDCFAELGGAIEVSSHTDFVIAKSRLLDAFAHLRRLSSINFDSIM